MGAAIMMVSGSCTKETVNEVNPEDTVKTVVAAGLPETKTYMGEASEGIRKVYWENGDAININGTASEALAGVAENTSNVEFTFDGALEAPYNAVYPASAYKNETTVTLAAAQGAADGTFAQNALPMAAYSAEEGALSFAHLCAVVKFSLELGEDAHQIDYLEFLGNNGEQISGDFTIDYETLALTSASTADADKVVKVEVDKALAVGKATDVYVVVPAGKYSKGFTVKAVDAEGHSSLKLKTSSCDLAAGKVYNMPEYEYAPIAGSGTADDPWVVSTADEWLLIAADMAQATPTMYKPNAHYALGGNIDFTGKKFTRCPSNGGNFTGVLDGKGYKMTGITAAFTGTNNGVIASNGGVVKNLTVEADWTSTGNQVGVVGKNLSGGLIENVAFEGTVSGQQSIGGVCGWNQSGGTINASTFLGGSVTSTYDDNSNRKAYVGGVCGQNAGTVVNCGTKGGGITAWKRYAGGVIGYNSGYTVNCYSWVTSVKSTGGTANANGNSIGGLCGSHEGGGVIINCYSTCEDFATASNKKRAACTVGEIGVAGAKHVYGTTLNVNNVIIGNNSTPAKGVFYVDKASLYWGEQKTLDEMKDAAFVTLLNNNITDYNGLTFDGKPTGITLKTWVADSTTGLPVFAE